MKFAGTDAATIVRSNVEEGSEFKIASNAKMFKLLSSGLYKYKVRAVIRELSCNAYDAHVMNGNPEQPFVMELPSYDNGYTFRIRDFGVGLSPEQIANIYTVYGASNKSHSNECIGGMGLGSKSPLCYAKDFNVISYYNGKKYLYNCGFNENGIPDYTPLGESDTIEPNGLEVSLVASRSDNYTFISEATEVFTYFNIKPTFVGSSKPSNIGYYTDNLDNKKIKGTDMYVGQGNFVVMGQVCYPIAAEEFRSKQVDGDDPWIREQNKVLNSYSGLLDMGIAFELPIGSVEVDIGREGLQYTKSTVAVLKAKFDEAIAAIKAEVESEINSAKNVWAAKIAYNELLNNKYHSARRLLTSVKIEYNGAKINETSTSLDTLYARQTSFDVTSASIIGSKLRKRDKRLYIEHTNKQKIFINDVKSAQYAQVKRWLEANRGQSALIVTPSGLEQGFFDLLGCDKSDVVYISSLPKIARQKGGVSKDFCFLFDAEHKQPYRSQRSASRYYKEVADDSAFDDCEAYFVIKNYEPDGTFCNSTTTIANTIKSVEKLLGISLANKILAVKSANAEKMIKGKDYVEIKEYLTDMINEYIANSNIETTIADCQHHNEHNRYGIVEDFASETGTRDIMPLINPDSTLAKAIQDSRTLCKFYVDNHKSVDVISAISSTLGIDIQGKTGYNVEVQQEEVKTKYPMLKNIQSMYSVDMQIVADYINLIDSLEVK